MSSSNSPDRPRPNDNMLFANALREGFVHASVKGDPASSAALVGGLEHFLILSTRLYRQAGI
jgi:hypothetical protein